MKKSLFLFFILIMNLQSCIIDKEELDDEWQISVGSELPRFATILSNGDSISNVTLSVGQSVIIFFNTSCPDCQRDLPVLEQQYRLEAPEGVQYVCIAREENAESIAEFWQQNDLTMPWSPQPDRAIYSLFATSGIPLIVTSLNGIIINIVKED